MLTRGNHKLGPHRIWTFSLPSGTPEMCPGMTATCRRHCYAIRLEGYRPAAAAKYRHNFVLSHRRDFARRVSAFIIAHTIRVVRIHCGGDFYSPRYARTWLRIMRRSPRVRFYFYSRAWVAPDIKLVIDRMARLPNCRVWYSADADTGIPTDVPPRVRVAWLATTPDDRPPPGVDLVFRVRQLRSQPPQQGEPPVCPTEDGVIRPDRLTCDRCGYCWRPQVSNRISLPVINPFPQGGVVE